VQTGIPGGLKQHLRLPKGQALGRTASCSPGRLDDGRYVPADQVADLGVADRPLKAVVQDLEGTGRRPIRQRIQRLLDIPGGELSELDVA
jgi:hypothetical protein